MNDSKAVADLKAANERLTLENRALRRALSLLHQYGCDVSNFVYGVLHGDRQKYLHEWEDDRKALQKASSRRLKALFAKSAKEGKVRKSK